MKTILKTLLVGLGVTVAFTSAAAAREVNCPPGQMRTEITTELYGNWWQTPQVGGLQNTRVAEIGGETTLVCEYRAYGTTVSVMRHPPERATDCTAHEGGFTCVRERARREIASTTHSTGSLSVPQTWHADLDTGQVGSGTADFWFHAVTARERYIEPSNGARLGIYSGGSGISKGDCVATPKSTDRIRVRDLPEGTYVCVRTSDGLHGVFRVNDRIGRSPGTLELGYTLWD